MGFAINVLFVGVTLLASLNQLVLAQNYGKVTCLNKNAVPSAKLLGSFLAAKCPLPSKFPVSDADAGKLTRSVYKHIKAYPPMKLDVLLKVLKTVAPKKYHDGMVQKLTACVKQHSSNLKDEASDPTGASFGPMYKCFANWYSEDLCK